MHDEDMQPADFYIGGLFYTSSGRWRCTDVGQRTAVAIYLPRNGPPCYPGPPYEVPEYVFDEFDMGGCERTYADAYEAYGENFARGCTNVEPRCACVDLYLSENSGNPKTR